MEFHEMEVTGRYNLYSCSRKVVRDKVVDLAIVHISTTHTTPQKFTPEAGRRVKGAQKNDMYFFLLRVGALLCGARPCAQRITPGRIANAMRLNVPVTRANLELTCTS